MRLFAFPFKSGRFPFLRKGLVMSVNQVKQTVNLTEVGRCIYCQSTVELSNEHIVARGLGGTAILKKASCEACRQITHKFETHVLTTLYAWPIRKKLGIKENPKRKKNPRTHVLAELQDGGSPPEIIAVPIDIVPLVYYSLRMPRAGMLRGRHYELDSENPEMTLDTKGDPKSIQALAEWAGAKEYSSGSVLLPKEFSRLIAKTCHAYAVSVVGLEGIEWLLTSFIRGLPTTNFYNLIGCADDDRRLEPPIDLALDMLEFENDLLLISRVTFLGNNRLPTYEVVVGRILDFDLIIPKILSAQHL